MQKVRVAIVGAGNISNTRHIPALKKLKNVEIVGVVGVKLKNVERTLKQHHIVNSLLITDGSFYESLKSCDWFQTVDMVAIGAPPRDHFAMVEASLRNNKHVLVEKPMTMDEAEADKLIALAKKQRKQFCVMHNFQFTSGIQRLERMIANGELGNIVSFYETQLTNRRRRLPEWYKDLPLGLFYDEAPHFMYLLEKFGGPLVVQNSFAQYGPDKTDETPQLLSVSLTAGRYPVNIFLNFDAPVCEWWFVACGDKKIAFYDLFKDILVVLPSDNEHYAADILKNSLRTSSQFWGGFIKNGFKMVSGNLLYGHETVMRKVVEAVAGNQAVDPDINAEAGRRTVAYMEAIVRHTNKRSAKAPQ
ncbi:MAG TPA: Gfo/Idh/MocA family oxidoreductase [Candidatus Saccharimonadales bacterium]|nr:Gfo/Idh/MocA family oxidoreductase [Candidatus Saccharimonadales bacterium]